MSSPEYGAAFIGLVIGAILYGMTILQVNSYFHNYRRDALWQKLCVVVLCILDTLHLCFSIHMMYYYLIDHFGNTAAASEITWSLKGLAAVQVLVIWLVQCLYLSRIYKLSRPSCRLITSDRVSAAVLVGIIVMVVLGFGIGILFIVEMSELQRGLSIASFRWAIFLGFSTTIVIDLCIALTMAYLLYKKRTGLKRTDTLLFTLIQYIIGTGLLTTIASITYVVLYNAKPDTLMYLAQEFSITRLYCNSYLAMINARDRFRNQIEQPVEVELNFGSSPIRFGHSTSLLGSEESNKHYHTAAEIPASPASPSSSVLTPHSDDLLYPPCLVIPVPKPSHNHSTQTLHFQDGDSVV